MVNASERALLRWRPQTAVMVDAGD
jgi:hypothetical protein